MKTKKPADAGFFGSDGQCLPNDGDGVTDIRGKHDSLIFALGVALAAAYVAAALAVVEGTTEVGIR